MEKNKQITIILILLILVGTLISISIWNLRPQEKDYEFKVYNIENKLEKIYGVYIELPYEMTGKERKAYLIGQLNLFNPYWNEYSLDPYLYIKLLDTTGTLINTNKTFEKTYWKPEDIPEEDDCINENVCYIKYENFIVKE